jgi:hypothetical protein
MAASPTERSWCVLEFARGNSFVAVNAPYEGSLNVVVTNETANIPLSNGSNIMYFSSVFVKIGFAKSSDNLYAPCTCELQSYL